MIRRVGASWLAFLIPAALLYQWFVHHLIVDSQSPVARVLVAVLPLVAFVWWIANYARNKTLSMLFVGGAAVLIAVLEHHNRLGLVAAYGVPHFALNLGLAWWFGRTLKPGRVGLITGFARKVHGALPAEMESYTRRITFAWTVFFAAQVLTSAALFAFAPLESWSFFANVLNLPLLALMFLVEYAYRVVRHRNFPHATIWQGIQAFADDVRPGSAH